MEKIRTFVAWLRGLFDESLLPNNETAEDADDRRMVLSALVEFARDG